MTCIVGLQHDGKVTIGGDSAGVLGYDITVRADSKVFTLGPYVMGFAGSFRMGQLLHHTFKPKPPTGNLDRFMVAQFIPGLMDCLKVGKWLYNENGRREGGIFLVGVNGRLFCIEDDFQVGHGIDGYLAIGCGDNIALGSLHSTTGQAPRARVKAALSAAAHHSAGVTPPFVIKTK